MKSPIDYRRQAYKRDGLCHRCGKEPLVLDDGRKSIYCGYHYELEQQSKARRVLARKERGRPQPGQPRPGYTAKDVAEREHRNWRQEFRERLGEGVWW